MIGTGSAKPVVSRMIWSNLPFFSIREMMAFSPVSRTVQHRQPLARSSHSSTRASCPATEIDLAETRKRSRRQLTGLRIGVGRDGLGRSGVGLTLDVVGLAELIHDDGDLAAMLGCEDVIEKSTFACTEVTCEDGERHFGCGGYVY